jgi:hypothetical protein
MILPADSRDAAPSNEARHGLARPSCRFAKSIGSRMIGVAGWRCRFVTMPFEAGRRFAPFPGRRARRLRGVDDLEVPGRNEPTEGLLALVGAFGRSSGLREVGGTEPGSAAASGPLEVPWRAGEEVERARGYSPAMPIAVTRPSHHIDPERGRRDRSSAGCLVLVGTNG